MIDCTKTENYFLEKARMVKRQERGYCGIKCRSCPLNERNNGTDSPCSEFEVLYPKNAIKAVQQWSNTHPQKTYLSELLKIFPNTPLTDNGIPEAFCPSDLGLNEKTKCEEDGGCIECWNQLFISKNNKSKV